LTNWNAPPVEGLPATSWLLGRRHETNGKFSISPFGARDDQSSSPTPTYRFSRNPASHITQFLEGWSHASIDAMKFGGGR
jgi:hypothetical protein